MKDKEIKSEPKVGDYVICSCGDIGEFDKYNDFIKDKIGKIVKYYDGGKYSYFITFDNIPGDLWNNIIDNERIIVFKREEIIYWNSDKDTIESIINSKKFNI